MVLYNYASIHKEKCPEMLKKIGIHIPAYYYDIDGNAHWDYQAIKKAIED